MSLPKSYEPEYGFQYQILTKYKSLRCFEHCDYAKDRNEKDYLLKEYKLAYGNDFTFRVIKLPKKYWSGKN
jgi:hypothetical protein